MTTDAEVIVAARPGLVRRSLPFLQLGAQLTFAAALLGLLLWRVDLAAVRDDLRHANLWWLPLAFAVNLFSDYFRAIRWREFFRPMRDVGVVFLWGVAIVGVACNLALPLRAGEFVRLQFLRKRTGLGAAQVLATILSEKLMDIVAFSAFLVIGIVFFEEAGFLWPLAVLYAFVLVAGLYGARWLASRAEEPPGLRPQPDGRLRVWAVEQMRSLGAGLRSFRSGRSLAIVTAASVAAWLCEAAMFYAVGRALGLDVEPAVYLVLVVVATVAVSVPLTQAGLGVFEVALTGTLVAFGVDKSEAAAFAIFSHVMLAVPYFATGPLAAVALRMSPGDIFHWKTALAVPVEAAAEA